MRPQSLLVSAALFSISVSPIVALIAWTRRPTRAGLAFLLLAAAIAAIWALYVAFLAADYRDADGFVDCWPHCTTWQKSVGWTLFGGPILSAALAGLALITAWRAKA